MDTKYTKEAEAPVAYSDLSLETPPGDLDVIELTQLTTVAIDAESTASDDSLAVRVKTHGVTQTGSPLAMAYALMLGAMAAVIVGGFLKIVGAPALVVWLTPVIMVVCVSATAGAWATVTLINIWRRGAARQR
ncbi:hypothetical protein [Hamadaea tsunoensis]|uniref:hypothetical protein n=1 Tax=Hamadaea tsunoensis TaxID=53368 RepID=UPI000485C231|nr:hypothetical protein [Hamadaea tsunoensis]